MLCETDDLVALSQHVVDWAPLLTVEVTPVIGDDEAGAAATKARSASRFQLQLVVASRPGEQL